MNARKTLTATLSALALGATLVATEADEVKTRIGDAPLHEGIDEDVFFLCRDETIRLGCVKREDALVEENHVLKRRRQFEIQARLCDDTLDLPKRIHHPKLTLVNHKQHGADEHERHQHRRNVKTNFVVHARFSVRSTAIAVTGAAIAGTRIKAWHTAIGVGP